MPYDVFKDSDRYHREERQRQKSMKSRADKPISEWGIRDVIHEFRDQYRSRYPRHSSDELGSIQTTSKILGKLRKDGVSVAHMRSAIDDFWAEELDKTFPTYPAWRKWLWKIRDQRPKDDLQFYNEQSAREVKPASRTAAPPSSSGLSDIAAEVDRLRAIYATLDAVAEDLPAFQSALAKIGWDEVGYAQNRTKLLMYERKLERANLSHERK